MKQTQWFSREEIKDIVVSVVVIAFVFAYPDMANLPVVFLAVILGFFFHEMAHRYLARKFGCAALYRMWTTGLLFALVITVASGGLFKFVAPGAVVIYPYTFGRWGYRIKKLTDKEEGIISVSGPAVNLFFAGIFLLVPGDIGAFISSVNAFLALFNLLPIPPLDGSKVLRWSWGIWAFLFIVSLVLVIFKF
jgi:Zn-dependent protease